MQTDLKEDPLKSKFDFSLNNQILNQELVAIYQLEDLLRPFEV